MNDVFTVEFLTDAIDDLRQIITTFKMLCSRNGAVRINEKILKAANQLSTFPYSAPVVPDNKISASGSRMICVEQYLMFYKVFESEKKIVIYRILNGKRNYPTLMNRLKSEYNDEE
ncbi:MAG: type II toxin-antitoxin system RelE/ParE family toxin [Oscillospiraceae bacterium]|nr:type II toxin-antitoxin system RelE/ParE family toxin [Oscillospiraceae bacterium]